jgi:hypothetical protein
MNVSGNVPAAIGPPVEAVLLLLNFGGTTAIGLRVLSTTR